MGGGRTSYNQEGENTMSDAVDQKIFAGRFGNQFLVGRKGNSIGILETDSLNQLTRDEAINLAAWLLFVVEPTVGELDGLRAALIGSSRLPSVATGPMH